MGLASPPSTGEARLELPLSRRLAAIKYFNGGSSGFTIYRPEVDSGQNPEPGNPDSGFLFDPLPNINHK